LDEIIRRKEAVLRRETDYRRWGDKANFEAHWSLRASYAADLCGVSKWVCDIGCGMQSLRNLIPKGSVYLPVDLNKWTADTLVCNLNQGEFPKKYSEVSDVVCLLGVIEYIYELDDLFESAAVYSDRVIVSYNPTDMVKSDRRGYGWVNDLTVGELEQLVGRHDFVVEDLKKIDGSQVILRMRSTRFSWMRRMRRTAARLSFEALK
jgi:hypothetical protein